MCSSDLKLFYGAFVFICCITADYLVVLYRKMKNVDGIRFYAALFIFLCVFSAVLTMGREAVSEYELYSRTQVELCEFIEKNTSKNAMILTDQRHNNAVSSLTGRSIVCGAANFLHTHGLDYRGRAEDVKKMYEQPRENVNLFRQYNVDFIVVSDYEMSTYPELNTDELTSMFEVVYSNTQAALLRVNR